MSSFSHITKEYITRANTAKLAQLREAVDVQEARLRIVRDNLEAEVESQGLPVRGIFSSTFFVRRSSAASWLAEAQAESDKREARDARELRSALKKIAARDDDDHRTPAPVSKRIVTDDEVRAAEVRATAARIVQAGMKRRGEIPEPGTLPPKGSVARTIIDEGRAARNLPLLED